MATVSPPASAAPLSGVVQNLVGIALAVMLSALGLAYLLDQAGRSDSRVAPTLMDEKVIAQTVGGRELTVPENWFRFGEQMQSGFVSQVDLLVEIPDATGRLVPVDVTLLPRSRARTSSELLDTVYVHQFVAGRLDGVPGLVGQRLEDRDGYHGETVWYDALAPKPFVAKCIAAVSGNAPDRCVRTVQLASGLAAIYSFDSSLLPAWRSFDAAMAQWLERAGAI